MRLPSAHLATFSGELAKMGKEIETSELLDLCNIFQPHNNQKINKWKKVLTQFADFVEYWNTASDSNEVVSPDPLVLDVMLEWELGKFG